MMYDGMMHGRMMWMMLCVFFGIILLAGVVLLILWAINSAGKGCSQAGEAAIDILNKRYASGEIIREEFERMKHDITQLGDRS